MNKVYDSTDINPIFQNLNRKIIINGNVATKNYNTNEYVVDWQMSEETELKLKKNE